MGTDVMICWITYSQRMHSDGFWFIRCLEFCKRGSDAAADAVRSIGQLRRTAERARQTHPDQSRTEAFSGRRCYGWPVDLSPFEGQLLTSIGSSLLYCESAWNKAPVFGVIGVQTGV